MSGLLEDVKKLMARVANRARDDLFGRKPLTRAQVQTPTADSNEPIAEAMKGLCQWTTDDDHRFVAASRTVGQLVPGFYGLSVHPTMGLVFSLIDFNTDGLLRFPDASSEKVIAECQKFWSREHFFRAEGLAYKRGIFLWGPPGSGKSCTIKILMADVIKLGGVILQFTQPHIFGTAFRQFREVQPQTPAIVLMEDLDSIVQTYSESDVLNIIDGVEQMDGVIFLATSNYPENLGPRVLNRPSRFDKVILIDNPSAESRKIYFQHLLGEDKIRACGIPLQRWVDDTDGMSLAHMKELYQAVLIMGDDYAEIAATLQAMKSLPHSEDYHHRDPLGFGAVPGRDY